MKGSAGTFALTALRLIAFRSYARLELAPEATLIALAGPNGAGKTNVLEAISLLSPGRGLRRAAPTDLPRRQSGFGWSVRAALCGPAGAATLWTGAEADGRRLARLDEDPAPVTALGRAVRVLWLTPALDRVFVEGPGERRRFLDRAALSFFPEHAETAIRYEKAMRERNRLLKDGVNDARWLSALEARMVDDGLAIAEARRAALSALLASQSESSVFPRAEARMEGDFETAFDAPAPEEAAARALRDGRREDSRAGRTLYGPHRSDLVVRYAAKDQPAAECSTGEQKALLVSLTLANARALARRIGGAPILLLDEIAAHFDAERRAALFAEIAELGGQCWMTGTEWPLFEALPQAAARFAVREGAEGSGLERLAPA